MLASGRLSLAHKQIILISVPLGLGLVFIFILSMMLQQARVEINREARSKAVMSAVERASKLLFDAGNLLPSYAVTRNPVVAGQFEMIEQDVQEEFNNARRLVASSSRKVAAIDRMQQVERRIFKILHIVIESIDEDGLDGSALHIAGLRTQFESLLQVLLNEMHQFANEERKIGKLSSTSAEAVWNTNFGYALAAGVLLNVLVSLFIAAFFSRNVTQRLGVMVQNARRIPGREPLLPALGGFDEIATLDNVFHDMAAELETARRKETAVLEHAVDVICSVDGELRFLAVNPACRVIFRYEPGDLLQKHVSDFMDDESASVFTALNSSRAGEQKQTFETNFTRKDGVVIDVLWSAQWSGAEQSFFCVAHDISERKRAEDRIRNSERKVRTIMESMPLGLLLIDESGAVRYSNQPAAEMTHYLPDALAGKSIEDILRRGKHTSNARLTSWLLSKASAPAVELFVVRADGSEFPAELTVRQLGAEELGSLLCVVKDITSRHEIEKLKREFVAMVSHDLRTPLSSIVTVLGMIGMGLFGKLDDQGLKTVGQAEKQADRLIQLINDLLDIEKMQAGKFSLTKKDVDIQDVILHSVDSVRRLADRMNIAIECDSLSVILHVDESRLIQVLINLLSNAIKFSPEGSTIVVSIAKDADWLEVGVRDHGRGIPEDQCEVIFEKFTQVKTTDATEKGGTGLGLAICRSIVDGHDGTIGVRNCADGAAYFWFRLPCSLDIE